tara:strand:+ start:299 stop:526 length:228 start_codon:yes stop_codon:yes gene_type:complete
MPTPQLIQPRNPDIVRQSALPKKKELLDPDELAGVEYGTGAAKQIDEATKKQGTDALKIALNVPAAGATGGTNVG